MNSTDYPTTPRKRSVWPAILLALAIIAVLALCAGIFTSHSKNKPVITPTETTSPAASPSIKVSSAVPAAVPASSAAGIGEGTYIVGQDVPAGKYRTTGGSDTDIPLCYWDVRTGSETGTIIAQGVENSVHSPGLVTLKSGQYFTTSGCAPWIRMH